MATPKNTAMQNLLRLTAIGWALQHEYRAMRRIARGAAGDHGAPIRLVARLVALGPVFVKLGQILSTRRDVLPKAYVEALAALQEHAPEVSVEQIRLIVERELGKPVAIVNETCSWLVLDAQGAVDPHAAHAIDAVAAPTEAQWTALRAIVFGNVAATPIARVRS